MQFRSEEINQLSAILEAEAAGHPIDHAHAHRLADQLRQKFPDIALTMGRAMERFTRLTVPNGQLS